MAYSKKARCWFTRLHLENGSTVTIPLLNENIAWLNESANDLAGVLNSKFIKEEIESGAYQKLLNAYPDTTFDHCSLEIPVKPSKQATHILSDSFHAVFQMYYTRLPDDTFLGCVPLLDVCAYGKSIDELKQATIANTVLELTRREIIDHTSDLIATQWYSRTEVTDVTNEIPVYSLNELDDIQERKKEKILPKVASQMNVDKKSAFCSQMEVESLYRALTGNFRRSVMVTGKPGSGKTSIIQEFLYQYQKKFSFNSFWQTNASTLLNQLTGQGGWMERLSGLCRELRDEQAILYIENFNDLFEVGQYEGNSTSIADYLQNYIKQGEITIISECSNEELSVMDLRSPGYTDSFQIIRLPERTRDIINNIVSKKSDQIARAMGVALSDEAIQDALRLHYRFMPYSGLPGKVVRFLENLIILYSNRKKSPVGRADVIKAFSEESGMPLFLIDPEMDMPIDHISGHFRDNLFGQDEAIETVIDVLSSVKTFLTREGKPIASLFFIGPTGVGKTEMTKILAEYVFSDRKRVIRFDMSEFSDARSVMRLIGDSPGEKSLLVDAVRKNPFSVVLFDELEKAHYSFNDLLLQVLGEGRLTDARGNVADFCSTIIIMTSNIGAKSYKTHKTGFFQNGDTSDHATRHFLKEVQDYFRPELFNRIDSLIPFLPLDLITMKKIANREMKLLTKREGIEYRKLITLISGEVLDKLASDGYDPLYGARNLQRTLRRDIVIPLSIKLNRYDSEQELLVSISAANDQYQFSIEVADEISRTDSSQSNRLLAAGLANSITNHRREVQDVENGFVFTNVRNELDDYIREKNRSKEIFFSNPKKVNDFYKLENMVREYRKTFQLIEELENLAFKCMAGMSEFDPALSGYYSEWKNNYEAAKLALYSHAEPESDQVVISVYGPPDNLNDWIAFYEYLINSKKFEYRIRQLVVNRGLIGSRPVAKNKKDNKPTTIDHIESDVIGIQIEIAGPASYLFFKGESGLHRFVSNDDNKAYYRVLVDCGTFSNSEIPADAHRKSFIQDSGKPKARRTVTDMSMDDKQYNVANEFFVRPLKLLGILNETVKDRLLKILITGHG